MAKPLTRAEALKELRRIDAIIAEGKPKPVRAPKPKPPAGPSNVTRIHRGLRGVLIWPDTHVPFEDKRAVDLVLRVAAEVRPSIQVAVGDFADLFSVSSHKKNPNLKERDLKVEIDAVNARLDQLDAVGGDRVITLGNHCDRLSRFLIEHAPALFNLVKIEELLRFKQRGWKWVPYGEFTRVGKIYVTHDVKSCGEGALKRTHGLFQGSTVSGHTHIAAMQFRGNARGDRQVSASFGWLGDARKVPYLPDIYVRANWQLGFGYGYMEPDGVMHLQPVPIINGRCVVGGQLFDARDAKRSAAKEAA